MRTGAGRPRENCAYLFSLPTPHPFNTSCILTEKKGQVIKYSILKYIELQMILPVWQDTGCGERNENEL